jgi:hypothetical protein
MNAVRVDTKVSRHTEPGIDSSVGRPPNENREYIATAESFLGGDSFVGLKLGGEVRSQEDEVEQLIDGSPFLDLESPMGVYEGIKCTIMFPVVILKVSNFESLICSCTCACGSEINMYSPLENKLHNLFHHSIISSGLFSWWMSY